MIGYRKSIQFTYNPNNALKQTITITDTGLEVQRTTTQYHYDAFGRRIAKNSKVETLNKLNQQGKLVKHPTTLLHLRKTDKTEHQSTLMLWEGNRQIQEYTNHHIFTTVYDQDSFEPVSRLVQDRQDTSQIKIYHYHNNHLGTPQELTDDSGNVVWCNYEYAWGGRYTHFYKEQFLNDCAIIESDLQPTRFQGQFYDVETGLHYNRFRYYDSDVGMFIQRDPIGLLGGWNVYQYAPNPVGWVDPWGLSGSILDNIILESNKVAAPNSQIDDKQIELLRQNSGVVQRRSIEQNKFARQEFEKSEGYLKKQWEKHTNRSWPHDSKGKPATAHHIIPLESGGANKWWNLMPTFGDLPNHSLPGIPGPHASGGTLRTTIQRGRKALPPGTITDIRKPLCK